MGNNKIIVRTDIHHAMVQDGDSYHVWFHDDALADNETINIAFKTPASTTKEIHMIVDWAIKAGGTVDIKEAATWTAQSGTILVPINTNRLSTNTSLIEGNETSTVFAANEVAYNVTTILTTNATTIESDGIFGTATKGGGAHGMHEFILKSETTYVIILTADGASNAGHLHLHWYEYLPNVI